MEHSLKTASYLSFSFISELRIENPRVGGSIPSLPLKNQAIQIDRKRLRMPTRVFFYLSKFCLFTMIEIIVIISV